MASGPTFSTEVAPPPNLLTVPTPLLLYIYNSCMYKPVYICVHLQPLLTHGANVNSRDLHGNTPLHIMCQDSKALECVADMVCVQWAYTRY